METTIGKLAADRGRGRVRLARLRMPSDTELDGSGRVPPA